ncbi:MAG: hypothetical protein ACXAEU_12210 [Candidatus Hodarchaeales archaeon]
MNKERFTSYWNAKVVAIHPSSDIVGQFTDLVHGKKCHLYKGNGDQHLVGLHATKGRTGRSNRAKGT